MASKFTAYITKHALTGGIEKLEVRDCFDISPTMVARDGHFTGHYHGGDWHRDYADALVKAESMRVKKIASLKKQIAKLEKMTFVEPQEAHNG